MSEVLLDNGLAVIALLAVGIVSVSIISEQIKARRENKALSARTETIRKFLRS